MGDPQAQPQDPVCPTALVARKDGPCLPLECPPPDPALLRAIQSVLSNKEFTFSNDPPHVCP